MEINECDGCREASHFFLMSLGRKWLCCSILASCGTWKIRIRESLTLCSCWQGGVKTDFWHVDAIDSFWRSLKTVSFTAGPRSVKFKWKGEIWFLRIWLFIYLSFHCLYLCLETLYRERKKNTNLLIWAVLVSYGQMLWFLFFFPPLILKI